MPATFPAHPAAVLPLKLWRPAWFDGVALAVGSMAPDLAYALDGSRLERPFSDLPPLWEVAHSLPWFLAWALPVTLAFCPLVRLSAPAFAAHLPAPLRTSAAASRAAVRRFVAVLVASLRAYGSLGRGPRWYITVFSAAIGALSHVLWDRVAVGPLDFASSLLGGLFGLWFLIRLAPRPQPAEPLAHHSAPAIAATPPSPPAIHAGPAPSPLVAPPAGFSSLAHTDSSALLPPGLPVAPSAGFSSRAYSDAVASVPAAQPSAFVPQQVDEAVADAGRLSPFGSPAQVVARSVAAQPFRRPSGGHRRRAARYWGTAGAVFVAGGAFLPFLPGFFLPHTTSARVILLAFAAFLAAAVAASSSRAFRREPLQQ